MTASLTLLCAVSSAHAVEVKPVATAQVLGGQYYYRGSESAAGALINASVAPYLKFNDKWSLVPLYTAAYKGTKQVADLVGGGTLFQDSQEHNLSLKGIYSIPKRWKGKAFAGYGFELLRETTDEKWGAGLYDNRRFQTGLESEYAWNTKSLLRMTYSFYTVRFPNYESLESQSTADLGRELSEPDVLDTQNNMVSVGVERPIPGNGTGEVKLTQTWRSFDAQHIVLPSGDLSGDKRNDSIQALSLDGRWPVWSHFDNRVMGTFGYTWAHLGSDQNHYDAAKTFFNENYYAYNTHALRTSWSLLVGDPAWTVTLGATLSRQQYSDRLVQDSAGNYGTDKTHVDFAAFSLAFTYPIAKNFRLMASSAFGWNDSNNRYSQMYQYHYNTATYLMGVSYAY